MAERESADTTRTCAGGGGVKDVNELERFVFDDELGLLFDARRKAPGRGVWVTPTLEHVAKATNGGFSRGFKTQVSGIDTSELIEEMIVGIERRLTDSVRSAIRARLAFIGGKAVEEGMRKDELALLVIAGDASESTTRKYGSNADRKSIATMIGLVDGAIIAEWCGREFVAVLGLATPFAERVERDLRHLRTLGAVGG